MKNYCHRGKFLDFRICIPRKKTVALLTLQNKVY